MSSELTSGQTDTQESVLRMDMTWKGVYGMCAGGVFGIRLLVIYNFVFMLKDCNQILVVPIFASFVPYLH